MAFEDYSSERSENEQCIGALEAAIETLQRAIEGSPTQGEFYHQLALLYARDNYAPRRAMRAIETALELSPNNAEYLRSRAYIRTLYKRYKATIA